MHLMALGAFSQMSFTPKNSKLRGLNAAYGDWCFLTSSRISSSRRAGRVLMHLMVLGAFSQNNPNEQPILFLDES